MNKEEALFDKIEAYLRGKLPPAEAAAFEREMAADPSLKEQVEMHRTVREGSELLLEEDLRRQMQAWKSAPPTGPILPSGKRPARRWLWTILPAVLAVVAGLYFFGKDKNATSTLPEPQEKTEQTPPPAEPPQNDNPENAQPEKPTVRKQAANIKYLAEAEAAHALPRHLRTQLRDVSAQPDSSLTAAGRRAYAAGKYKTAIIELKKIKPEDNPQQYALAQEWLAHAYFKNRQFADAAAIFQSMTEQDNVATVQDRAEWYLLLSLLPDHEQQKQRVNQLFEKMLNPDNRHEYFQKATDLKASL